MKAIELVGLARHFGSVTAVDGIDLEVDSGEIFGFLGPNGAGKTTCVRMLVTLLRPTAGEARVGGFDVVRQSQGVRHVIGVALQDTALDPLMTGRELILLQGTLHAIPRAELGNRSAQLLEQVGLVEAGDRLVATYSGGMRRRLDLALALVHEPQVLFLDEPTAGLDPTSRVYLWEEVRRLNRERGTTVFLTTQYLEEADQVAHRVAIIDQGRIVRDGAPDRLKGELGAPTLTVAVAVESRQAAQDLLARFGQPASARADSVAVRLVGGATALPDVVRALDGAGIVVETLELAAPSLDDVFVQATGRRLEGAHAVASEAGQALPA